MMSNPAHEPVPTACATAMRRILLAAGLSAALWLLLALTAICVAG
jgi:hypothetical protein